MIAAICTEKRQMLPAYSSFQVTGDTERFVVHGVNVTTSTWREEKYEESDRGVESALVADTRF